MVVGTVECELRKLELNGWDGEEPFRFAWGDSFKQVIFFLYFATSFVIVICVVTV